VFSDRVESRRWMFCHLYARFRFISLVDKVGGGGVIRPHASGSGRVLREASGGGRARGTGIVPPWDLYPGNLDLGKEKLHGGTGLRRIYRVREKGGKPGSQLGSMRGGLHFPEEGRRRGCEGWGGESSFHFICLRGESPVTGLGGEVGPKGEIDFFMFKRSKKGYLKMNQHSSRIGKLT